MDLLAELEERLVCGDGAMGTLLLDRGVPVDRCLEELCISDPDRIRAIHEEYVAAGARVIETNTFGANAIRLARFGKAIAPSFHSSRANRKGVCNPACRWWTHLRAVMTWERKLPAQIV